ncbi:hypothetical protein [Reichenbachiella versicolor]|uniref:hypothetical protein n=1 Tax=Reichenbachiella versicolor TaxID=1821036 RepID=UPI000D6E7ADB|nr:hypothetical protein [Reichenbachiella versicolor]
MKTDKKINWVDKAAQKAVNKIESVSVTNIDKSKIWKQICLKLENIDKKILSWFMVTATSVTMLIAAGLEYISYNRIEHKLLHYPNKETSHYSIAKEEIQPQQEQFNQKMHLNASIPVKMDYSPINRSKKLEINGFEENIEVKNKKTKEILNRIEMEGKISASQNNIVTPSLGLGFKFLDLSNNIQNKSLFITSNIQWLPINQESTISKITPLIFVNLKHKTTTEINGMGWEYSAGYLVTPNNLSPISGQTLRFSAIKRLNKNIGIGPEIYLTKSLKQLIPAITLTISS